VAHVGIGVAELRIGQRPARPVRPLLLLVEANAGHELADQRRQPDLIAQPRERGHRLGIDDVRHRHSEPRREELQILTGRVRDGARVSRDRGDDGADVHGERVEESHRRFGRDDLSGLCIERNVRDLHQAQRRDQALLCQELQVERDQRRSGHRCGNSRDALRVRDQRRHVSHCNPTPGRFRLERAH